MVPAALTIPALLTNGETVVTAFGGLIVLIGGLAFGVYVVRFVIRQIKGAR